MTRDEILNMEAGRKMDALVAQKVFGYKIMIWINCPENEPVIINMGGEVGKFGTIERYSTSIAAAWEVIENLKAREEEKYQAPALLSYPHGWICVLYGKNDGMSTAWLDAFAPTAPLAICRAALLAVMDGAPC